MEKVRTKNRRFYGLRLNELRELSIVELQKEYSKWLNLRNEQTTATDRAIADRVIIRIQKVIREKKEGK